MVIHYPPARLRRNSDQPTAITDVLINRSGSSSRSDEIPLGSPTCSARSRQGTVALSDHPVRLPPLHRSKTTDHGHGRVVRPLLGVLP
jgi:hypothetical protein